MKRVPKPVFFIVALLILAFSFTAIFGISYYNGDNKNTVIKGVGDIRWGIDIRGGVEATFKPADGYDATDRQLQDAKAIIELRMVSQGITDYELYADTNSDRIIVRFPWKSDEKDFDAMAAINEISSTAELTLRPGAAYTTTELGSDGNPVYKTPKGDTETVLMKGNMVSKATSGYINDNDGSRKFVVDLELTNKGAETFKDITTKYLNQQVSIWMDDIMLSAPNVSAVISNGKAQISGNFTSKSAADLAQKINAGALPFKLETSHYGNISPTLGENALTAMAYAAVIAFIVIALIMIIFYRLPGFVAIIALMGQMALSVAAVSGYFTAIPSFTMTLPGIAGIILNLGMAVDANVIIYERIREELRVGKTLNAAVSSGYKHAVTAIVDANITTTDIDSDKSTGSK